MTKRRVIVLALAAALVLSAFAGCSNSGGTGEKKAEGESKAPYKIGAVLSLTGTYAGLGQPEKNTLEMERDRVNAAGGINGHPVELVIVDDATDPTKAQQQTVKLLDEDKVIAVIGATGTGQTMAMRSDIDRAQVPQVSVAGGTAITGQFDKFVFQTPWSNSIVIPLELNFMASKGAKKIGIISDAGGFGKDGLAVTEAQAPKSDLTIVAKQTYNAGDTDMSSQLTAIKAAKPDALMVIGAGKEAAMIVKNAKDLGLDVPVYGTHGNARIEFIQGAGDAANGFTFAAGKILLPDTYGKDSEAYKVATDFIDRYTGKFGKAPDTFAGHAYDAFNITVNALKTLPAGFTPTQLRDAIENTQNFVGIGGTFNYSASDHNGMNESDLVMYKVENGKWVLAQ